MNVIQKIQGKVNFSM